MAPRCGERHRFLLPLLGLFSQVSVELPVHRQDAATGPRAELDTHLLQFGVDAELPEAGVALQPTDDQGGAEFDLPKASFGGTRFWIQACESLGNVPA